MELLWPGSLALLGVLPVVVGLYIWALRRRRRFAVRFSSLSLVRSALPRHSWLRRHLPFALFLLALASLIGALARPVATVQVPAGRATIVLALDVSRSMLQDDIAPNRIVAAQEAALSFVGAQEPGTQMAVVAFAGFAEMVQEPSSDQQAIQEAIARLRTGRGTAIGSGILESLDVISGNFEGAESAAQPAAPAPPPGGFAPDVVVLLTDGVTTTGPAPLEAAQRAVERGVRVYTIGFGTARGGSFPGNPQGGAFGGQQGGGRFRRGIDEATLQQVADMTGGEYYPAESAADLQEVFRQLPLSLVTRAESTELSAALTALGALLAALGVGLSLAWNRLL